MLLSPFADGRTSSLLMAAELVWQYSPGLYLPGNNQDAAASVIVAARETGGALRGNGETVLLPFTTAGGVPTVGNPVYLAASQDDSNTGRGKATATLPSLAVPVVPAFAQNRVGVAPPLGVCVATPSYAPVGYYAVLLSLPTRAGYGAAPVDSAAVLNRTSMPLVGGAVVNVISTNGAIAQQQLLNGQTIIIAFTMDQVDGTASVPTQLWGDIGAGGTGAAISMGNSGSGLSMYAGPGQQIGVGIPNIGLNYMALWRTGGQLLGSLNGGAIETLPDATSTPTGAATSYAYHPWGGMLYTIKLNKIVTGAQLAALINYAPILTPYQPPASHIADAQCQWYTDFTAYTAGPLPGTAGPAGVAFTWTVAGALTVISTTLNWLRNPSALFLDGTTPVYDSQHLSVHRAFQNLQYTLPVSLTGLVSMGFAAKDPDNNDEDAITRYDIPTGGGPEAATGVNSIGADGTIVYQSTVLNQVNGTDPISYWRTFFNATVAGTDPAITTRLGMSDLLQRADTFNSGSFLDSLVIPSTAAFITDATANRLVLVGGGGTLGGHSANALFQSAGSGSVVSRIRFDYPGRVTAISVSATQSLKQMREWGNGSVVPYARYLYDAAQRGTPGTIIYCATFGFDDWALGNPLATFGPDLALFLSTLHGLDSGQTFSLAKAPQTHLYANVNINGDHLQAFVDLVVAQSGWTLIDVTVPNSMTGLWQGTPASLPTTPAGQVALKGNYKAALGY